MHAWIFMMRKDIPSHWVVTPLRGHPPHPLDVCVVLKHRLYSTELAQAPCTVVPSGRMQAMVHVPVPPSVRQPHAADQEELLSLAQALLRLHGNEAGVQRTAQYLMALARNLRARGPLVPLPWHEAAALPEGLVRMCNHQPQRIVLSTVVGPTRFIVRRGVQP